MRCHVCNSPIAEDTCLICNRYTCSLCLDEEGICKRCSTRPNYGSYQSISFPSLSSVSNPALFIIGLIAVIAGFAIVAYSFMQSNAITDIPRDMPKDGSGGFIYIFPFIFIGSADMAIIIPIMIIALLLPIIIMFWLMRRV